MANVKISQLPVASTPLAGSEEIPLVQGGITKQVTVDGLLTSANLGTPSVINLTYATNVPVNEATGVLPVANGGTGAATAAAGIENLLPSYSGNANKRLGLNSGATGLEWVADGGGTVTSVGMSVPSFLSISGSPITSSGTLAVSYSGTALPVANGGTGQITANDAFNALAPSQTGNSGKYLTTDGTNTSWATNPLGTVTSVAQSFTGGLISVSGSPITTSGTLALTVAGTSGGIPYFSSASTWATSAALGANAIMVGGGAGLAPSTITTGTGVVTALGVNTGSAGAFVVNGGALGTPSSGTVTNLTGTASININGTVGATTPTTGAFTTLTTSSTVTLNGGTANGVTYLNGSKVLTSGSALTFDGSSFNVVSGLLINPSGTAGVNATIVANTANNNYLLIKSAAVNSYGLRISVNAADDVASITNYYNAPLTFGVSNTEQMRLTSTGLGIGTSSPAAYAKLTVAGTAGAQTGASQQIVVNAPTTTAGQGAGIRLTAASGAKEAVAILGVVNQASGNAGAMTFHVYNGGADVPEYMRLDSSGNLGLGVTPTSIQSGYKGFQIGATVGGGIVSAGTDTYFTNNAYVTGGSWYFGSTGYAMYYNQSGGVHSWTTSSASGSAGGVATMSERMRLDASGKLLVGLTSGAIGALSLQQIGGVNATLFNTTNDAYTYLINNGSEFRIQNSYNSTAGYKPITFYANGSENARIDSSGNLGIGTSSPAAKLDVRATAFTPTGSNIALLLEDRSTNSQALQFYLNNAGTYYSSRPSGAIGAANAGSLRISGNGVITGDFSPAVNNFTPSGTSAGVISVAGTINFYTAGSLTAGTAMDMASSERARIDSDGNFLINCTSVPSGGSDSTAYQNTGDQSWVVSSSGTGASYNLKFYNGNGLIGSIITSGSATAYNTSSDYRLKENIAPMTGALSVISQLKPCTYTWKADGSNGQGFIAHELQAVVPDAVVGEKDAVNEDGSIKPQGIDTSFLVATLTAAIQEQQALITQLQARLDAANL